MSQILDSLKSEVQKLKDYSRVYLQQSILTGSSENTITPLLQNIQFLLNESISQLVKAYLQRSQEIETLKQQIEYGKNQTKKLCRILINSHSQLENSLQDSQTLLQTTQSTSKIQTGSIPVKDLILFSHRIGATAGAPTYWKYTQTLPRTFKPPAPQEHQIRSTLLFTTENQDRANKPEITMQKTGQIYTISMQYSSGPAIIRYTLDNSIPSVYTGKIYEQPFDLPSEIDFLIKAVAVVPGLKESVIAVASTRDDVFVKPQLVAPMAQRPEHTMNTGQLDLKIDISPYSSSIHSSDEDNEFSSPYFFTFNK